MAAPRKTRRRARGRTPDDAARITRALDGVLVSVVEQRIDAIALRYEGAFREARARLARIFEAVQQREAQAGRPPLPKATLPRVIRAQRVELELAFLRSVEAEVEAAAVLRGTLVEALDRVSERVSAAEREGAARITAAFLRFHAESWLMTQVDAARTERWLATLGPPRPRSRAEKQAQLVACEEAVARVGDDEREVTARASNERANAEEWEKRVALASAHGADDLVAEARARAEQHTRLANELDRYGVEQREARESFEQRLGEIRASLDAARTEPGDRSSGGTAGDRIV